MTIKHRLSSGAGRHPLYGTWANMRWRCLSPACKSFHNYGGRGITICPEWGDFSVFAADMGARPKGYTLERIDNDAGYSKQNCVWAPRSAQMHNVRYNRWIEHDGESLILQDWAAKLGITPATLWWRLDRYSVHTALTMKGYKHERSSRTI